VDLAQRSDPCCSHIRTPEPTPPSQLSTGLVAGLENGDLKNRPPIQRGHHETTPSPVLGSNIRHHPLNEILDVLPSFLWGDILIAFVLEYALCTPPELDAVVRYDTRLR
jgi:hypothetical protein